MTSRQKAQWNDPGHDAPPETRLVTRESIAAAATMMLLPFDLLRRKSQRPLPRDPNQRTVVLIHGLFANPACFLPMRAWLAAGRRHRVLSFSWSPRDSAEVAARKLREFLRINVRGGRIDLVTHSMGGLIAEVFIEALGGDRRVDRCINLGTPHGGTWNAAWGLGHVHRDLRPNSKFIARLRERRKNSRRRVAFTAIVGDADNVVLPRLSAATRGRKIRVKDTGHLGLLWSPAVFRIVNRLLLVERAH